MPRVVKQKLVKLVCFVSEAEKSALENEANAVGINASEFVRRILDARRADKVGEKK